MKEIMESSNTWDKAALIHGVSNRLDQRSSSDVEQVFRLCYGIIGDVVSGGKIHGEGEKG